MAYETCENCGGRVYKYGCVNCNEEDYIAEQHDENESNRHELRVIKPPKFKPSELNYLEDLIDKNIEDGTYWGNRKQFIERQKNVKEKIINLRAAL